MRKPYLPSGGGGRSIAERTDRRKNVRVSKSHENSRLFLSFRFSLVPDVGAAFHLLPFTTYLDAHTQAAGRPQVFSEMFSKVGAQRPPQRGKKPRTRSTDLKLKYQIVETSMYILSRTGES